MSPGESRRVPQKSPWCPIFYIVLVCTGVWTPHTKKSTPTYNSNPHIIILRKPPPYATSKVMLIPTPISKEPLFGITKLQNPNETLLCFHALGLLDDVQLQNDVEFMDILIKCSPVSSQSTTLPPYHPASHKVTKWKWRGCTENFNSIWSNPLSKKLPSPIIETPTRIRKFFQPPPTVGVWKKSQPLP